MALTQRTPRQPGAEDAADQIRRSAQALVAAAEQFTRTVRGAVELHGRAPLMTALGQGDAADLLLVYGHAKSIARDAAGRTLPDLPQ